MMPMYVSVTFNLIHELNFHVLLPLDYFFLHSLVTIAFL